MTDLQTLTSVYLRYRFACLFFSLMLTLVVSPMLAALGVRSLHTEAFLFFNLLTAVFSLTGRRIIHVGLVLVVLAAVARGGFTIFGLGQLLPASQGFAVVACLMSSFVLLRSIFGRGRVDAERIFACLSLYLLIGVVFGLLFFLVEEFMPASFASPGLPGSGTERFQLAHALYFSFVTLGTLGYGDIIPVSGPARSLAVAEAMIGQMYIAVVVARLVALHRGDSESVG